MREISVDWLNDRNVATNFVNILIAESGEFYVGSLTTEPDGAADEVFGLPFEICFEDFELAEQDLKELEGSRSMKELLNVICASLTNRITDAGITPWNVASVESVEKDEEQEEAEELHFINSEMAGLLLDDAVRNFYLKDECEKQHSEVLVA
jgi:hypothetical protein